MTEDLLLTAAERRRFASYLEREAATSNGLADQVEHLVAERAEIHLPEAMIRQFRAEAAAATIIARKLRSIEDDSVRG